MGIKIEIEDVKHVILNRVDDDTYSLLLKTRENDLHVITLSDAAGIVGFTRNLDASDTEQDVEESPNSRIRMAPDTRNRLVELLEFSHDKGGMDQVVISSMMGMAKSSVYNAISELRFTEGDRLVVRVDPDDNRRKRFSLLRA